jgi:hypothetical protein
LKRKQLTCLLLSFWFSLLSLPYFFVLLSLYLQRYLLAFCIFAPYVLKVVTEICDCAYQPLVTVSISQWNFELSTYKVDRSRWTWRRLTILQMLWGVSTFNIFSYNKVNVKTKVYTSHSFMSLCPPWLTVSAVGYTRHIVLVIGHPLILELTQIPVCNGHGIIFTV